MRIFLILLFFILFTGSCKRSEKDEVFHDPGYAYFPVNPGHEVIYDVDSVIYDDFNDTVVTYTYQLKELIAGYFVSANGQGSQRIEWYYRDQDTSEWSFQHAGSSTRTLYTAELVKDNERIIKMVFPVQPSKSWNGYAYTSQTGKPAYFTAILGKRITTDQANNF
jgi:hypothetical protein